MVTTGKGACAGTRRSPDPDLVGRNDVRIPDAGNLDALPIRHVLRRSMEGAVRAQKAYAAAKHIPWGISEAGYSELDDAGIYRYAAIGVPELALREQEQERLVVAPYASAMALAVAPADALDNLRRMAELGWLR